MLVSNTSLIKKYRNIFISVIITIDILVFGFISTKDSLIKSTTVLFPSTNLPTYIEETTNAKRVLDLTDSINTGNNLVETAFGMNGYSVLYIDKINQIVKNMGLKSLKHTLFEDEYFLNDPNTRNYFYTSVKELGIEYIINNISSYQLVLEKLNPYSNNVETYYRKEGKVLIETNSTEDILLNTYVLNYPGWEVYLNGIELDTNSNSLNSISNNDAVNAKDIFINIPLSRGKNVIFLEFYPKDLYFGLNISIIMLILCVVISYILFFSKYRKFEL